MDDEKYRERRLVQPTRFRFMENDLVKIIDAINMSNITMSSEFSPIFDMLKVLIDRSRIVCLTIITVVLHLFVIDTIPFCYKCIYFMF